MTGSIFNTADWKEVGGLKPQIKLTFWYEWMLRLTNKGKDIFVIPKIIIIQNPIEKNTIIHNSKEDPFYNICFVKNNFSEIKEFFLENEEKVLLNKEEKLIVEAENE